MIELLIAELRDLYEALGTFIVLHDTHLRESDDLAKAAVATFDDKRFRALPAMLELGVIYRWLERALRRRQAETTRELRLTDVRRMMHLPDQDVPQEYWDTLEVLSDTNLLRPAHNAYAGIWMMPPGPFAYYEE